MRKLLALLLALCSLAILMSCGGCSGNDETKPEEIVDGYLTYILQEDGTYSVKATDVTDLPGTITIPESYNGIPVTALEQYAFARSNCLQKITIPESIIRLPAGALYQCTTLVEVNLPSTLVGIGKGAVGLCWEYVYVYYDGTKADWKQIMKASNWIIETEHTVICTDGSIS